MKKILIFSFFISFLTSCHFLVERNLAPTLIIKGSGVVVSSPENGVFETRLGNAEFTSYVIGEIKLKVKSDLLDTVLVLNLEKDLLTRIDIEGQKIIKSQHNRY